MPDAFSDQKVLNLLVQVAVSFLVGAGNLVLSLCKSKQCSKVLSHHFTLSYFTLQLEERCKEKDGDRGCSSVGRECY